MDKKWVVFTGIGFELVGLVVAAIIVGGMLDHHFALSGFATAGLILIATGGWIYHLIILLQKVRKDE